ncbi:hypothetical protein DPEC_G00378200 [Dallia pectoralis]|nr:hypothetical protein DPEC_G00378200 [Dallia pectoralis]
MYADFGSHLDLVVEKKRISKKKMKRKSLFDDSGNADPSEKKRSGRAGRHQGNLLGLPGKATSSRLVIKTSSPQPNGNGPANVTSQPNVNRGPKVSGGSVRPVSGTWIPGLPGRQEDLHQLGPVFQILLEASADQALGNLPQNFRRVETESFGKVPDPASFSAQYYVGRVLGTGGFGSVHNGTRKRDGKNVALKFIRKGDHEKYLTFPGTSLKLPLEVGLQLMVSRPRHVTTSWSSSISSMSRTI